MSFTRTKGVAWHKRTGEVIEGRGVVPKTLSLRVPCRDRCSFCMREVFEGKDDKSNTFLTDLEAIVAPRCTTTIDRQLMLLLMVPVYVDGVEEVDQLLVISASHLKSPTFSGEFIHLSSNALAESAPPPVPFVARHEQHAEFNGTVIPKILTETELARGLVGYDRCAEMQWVLARYEVQRPGLYLVEELKPVDIGVVRRENQLQKELASARKLLKESLSTGDSGRRRKSEPTRRDAHAPGRGRAGARGGGRGRGRGGRGRGGLAGGDSAPGDFVDPTLQGRRTRVYGRSNPTADVDVIQSTSESDSSAGIHSELDVLAHARAEQSRADRRAARTARAQAESQTRAKRRRGPQSKAPERRGIKWGPFLLSRVMDRRGAADVQIGWGATCYLHHNRCDKRACRARLDYGTGIRRRKLDDAETYHRIRAWCCCAAGIVPNATEADDHMRIDRIGRVIETPARNSVVANVGFNRRSSS